MSAKKTVTLPEALKTVVERKGREVFQEPDILNAFLSDLAPEEKKDIHILVDICRHHYFDGITKCSEDNLSDAISKGADQASLLYAKPVVDHIAEMLYQVFDLEKEKPEFEIRDSVLQAYHGTDASVVIPPVRSIAAGAFRDNREIREVTVPEGVSEIPDSCFKGCANLRGVSLPSSLRTIGSDAFKGCYQLKEIALPDMVNTIRSGAFEEEGSISAAALFSNCARYSTNIAIADSWLADAYSRLKSGNVKGSQAKAGKTRMIPIALAVIVVCAVLVSVPFLYSGRRRSTRSSTSAPVKTAEPALVLENSTPQFIIDGVETMAGNMAAGAFEDVIDELYTLKYIADEQSLTGMEPYIIDVEGTSDKAGLYQSKTGELGFYFGPYNSQMQRDGIGHYFFTEKDHYSLEYTYDLGEWIDDCPEGTHTQQFWSYDENRDIYRDEEITLQLEGGIYNGPTVLYNRLKDIYFDGYYHQGIADILEIRTDEDGIERKAILVQRDGDIYYSFREESEYSTVHALVGFEP